VKVLLPPQVWTTIDYTTREDPNASGTMNWVVEEQGTADFICVWFNAELMNGIGFTTAPNSDGAAIYGRAMMPLEKSVQLEPGDQVQITLNANLIGSSYHYTWKTHVVSGGTVKADFRQSTFFGMLLSDIRKRALDYTPQINTRGQMTRLVLSSMDEALPINAIAQRLREAFPGEFLNEGDALAKVCNITSAYGK
jgi:protein arginine N-methyltransferase 1